MAWVLLRGSLCAELRGGEERTFSKIQTYWAVAQDEVGGCTMIWLALFLAGGMIVGAAAGVILSVVLVVLFGALSIVAAVLVEAIRLAVDLVVWVLVWPFSRKCS